VFYKKRTIGLVLGGGGARGGAHIGALKVLHNKGIIFDRIAGTSAGAIMGAMYAATLDPDWMEDRLHSFIKSDVFKKTRIKSVRSDRNPDSVFGQMARYVHNRFVIAMAINKEAIVEKKILEDAIKYLVPVNNFNDLKIPISIVCSDLNSGETIVHEEGDLIEAVVQSSSIPGFIEPTIKDGRRIVDGGVTAPFPSNILKDKVDFILGINISRGKPLPMKNANLLEIITRTEMITSLKLTESLVKQADFVIKPDTLGLHWSEFNEIDKLIENGTNAAEEAFPMLINALNKKPSLKQRLGRWIGSD